MTDTDRQNNPSTPPRNGRIANRLEEMAELLARQGGNPFRVRAYRRAAETLAALPEDVGELLQREGPEGLIGLPHIGKGIASAIVELVTSGHWSQLQRLRGRLDPLQLFQTVPGIGPGLARRISDRLHIDTLEALENAAYDGRLAQVPGIGLRRLAGIRAALASMLGRPRERRFRRPDQGPPVSLLLEVDRRYRQQAEAGTLPTIAPRRFNPSGEAWLPVLHMEKEGWHFTAMYSNTPLAHQLHRTRDWVIIYCYDDHHQEEQYTVVTETRGPFTGQRVVRGREPRAGRD